MSRGTAILQRSTGAAWNQLTLFAEDSPARILASSDDEPDYWPDVVADSGASSSDALTESGRDTSLLRMSPAFLAETIGFQDVAAAPSAETLRSIWRPPPWRTASIQSMEALAFLADGRWMTAQGDLFDRAGSAEFSETWPLSGTMRNGSVFQRPPLAPRTCAIASLSSLVFPTPTASEAGKSEHTLQMVLDGESQMTLDRYVRLYPPPQATDGTMLPKLTATERIDRGEQVMLSHAINDLERFSDQPISESGTPGELNPTWVEWLMGFPIGWTDYAVSVTPSFRQSQSGSDAASSQTPDRLWPTPRASDTGRPQWKSQAQASRSRFSTMLSSAVLGLSSGTDTDTDDAEK